MSLTQTQGGYPTSAKSHMAISPSLSPTALSNMHAKNVFTLKLKSQQNLRSPKSR